MNYIILISLFFLTACSTTVDFHGSTNIFTGPEVIGKTFGLDGQLGLGNSTKFILATLEQKSIFSSQITTNTDAGMHKDNNINSHFGLGLSESFELYYRMMGDSPDPVGLKWQILGSGVNKKAAGIKFLVFGGVSGSYTDNNKLTAANGSGASRTYSSNLKVSMTEFGASLGYRVNPNGLFYITPFYRQYGAKDNLTSTSYSDVIINKNALVRGIALGTIINFGALIVNLETGYAHSQYSSTRLDNYSLGGSLGFNVF